LICKEWIADVYDAFARCRNDSVDFKKLQSLLNEGERLSFRYRLRPPSMSCSDSFSCRCVLEETQLRRSFRDLERIADDGEGLLERINQPHPGHLSLFHTLLSLSQALPKSHSLS
jgi:arginyl-tRNA--protein-N-Asp/Glu arginylyltransferase